MKRRYDGELIFEGKDEFGTVEVVDGALLRTLHFGNDVIQSSMYLKDPIALEMEYNRLMILSTVFNPDPDKALFLGLGGGAKQKFLWKFFSNCQIETVEISPLVIETFKKYFSVSTDHRFVIHQEDALQFLKQAPDQEYQLIFVDLYVDKGIAPGVAEEEFFPLCQQKLKASGILIWNLWQFSQKEFIDRSLKHLERLFGMNLLTLPNDESPNLVIYAFNKPVLPYTLQEIKKNAERLKNLTSTDFPKILADLNFFKGYGNLFQEWMYI